MRLVFAHDHTFYKYEKKLYSTGGLSKEMLERYTSVFDEVVVVSRQKELSYLDRRLTLASAKNISFSKIPNFKSLKNSIKIIQAKKIIKVEVKNSDVVISRLPSAIGNIAIKCAKKYNKPYLIEVVACPWDSYWNHGLRGKLVASFVYYATKKRVRDAKYVIYVTNEFLQRRYPTNGKSINCSNVALTEFNNNVLEARLHKIHNMDNNRKTIIGTIAAVNVKYKGQRYIIKALGKLKERGITNYEYQLVGGGDQTYLKSMAKKYDVPEQVKFLGPMPHDEVFQWLDTIDIYVQPSRQEGLPRALIEAMSRGLPAFGARTAGIPELLESQFIFSNTRKNVDEICEILQSFNKEIMIHQAKRNYEESKKYDKSVIEERRKNFFLEFKNSIKE